MAVKLIGVSLMAREPAALAAWYEAALGFTRVAMDDRVTHLAYGTSRIELLDAGLGGRPVPAGAASNDAVFQHFALLTEDIDAACDRLADVGDFLAISRGGPVKLPQASGGVTAFKFRDPEGHPLEFIQPLKAAPARIDHTAIVVRDTDASVRFYAGYGLKPVGGSLNQGAEQAALDALDEPVVTVTRLAGDGKLALELLCYHQPPGLPAPESRPDDIWATRQIYQAEMAGAAVDPDGHAIACRTEDMP